MYILKNAWLNITRNKSRNILIGLIIMIISCSATITLAIKNTASSLIKSYKDAYKVTATISFSRQNMKQNFDYTNEDGMNSMKETFSSLEAINKEDILSYASSEYVEDYYYTYSVSLNSSSIEKVSSDFSFEKEDKKRPSDNENDMVSADFTLTGYSSVSSMTDFIQGNYTMSENKEDYLSLIFDGNYCMINKELALLNDISIDDEITFTNPNNDEGTITLTVIGIFEEQDNDTDSMSMFSTSANMIITNVDVIDNIKSMDDELNTTVTPTFILTSYSDATLFANELYEKGLNEYYTLTTNEKDVTNATSSVANVSSFATTFLILTLVIGAIILFVINQINIRERKYEIGVLRTIGMKKSLLMLQFLLELTIVSFIFLCLGAGIGALASKPVSNMLLQNEISSSTNTKEEMNKNFGEDASFKTDKFDKVQGVVNIEAYESINAVCDIKVIFELIFICLLLILIGSTSAIISIQKFSPLEILKERS